MSGSSSQTVGGRLYAGKPPGQRHAERYRRFIEAGIEVIGTRGYAAASVKAVCTEAGLTERYFYQCFNNREALLAAVYQHLNDQLHTRTLEALSNTVPEPIAMARAGARVWFGQLRDDPRVARILLFEAVGVSERLAELNREAEARQVALIRGTTRRRDDETLETLVAAGLVGAAVNIAMRWVLEDYKQSLDDVVSSLVVFYEALGQYMDGEKADNKP